MTFSRTTEYALRVLSFIAHGEKEYYSSAHLHARLKIPKKYLQRLLTKLSKKGLIKSVRGKHGGYALARPTGKIFIADIIEAVEGFQKVPSCFFGYEKCTPGNPCSMHEVWSAAQNKMIKALSSTPLTLLVAKKR